MTVKRRCKRLSCHLTPQNPTIINNGLMHLPIEKMNFSKPFIGQQLHIDMQNGRFRNPLRRQPHFAPDQNGTLSATPNPGQHFDHRPPHPIHDPLLIKRPRNYHFIFHNRQYVFFTNSSPHPTPDFHSPQSRRSRVAHRRTRPSTLAAQPSKIATKRLNIHKSSVFQHFL